MTINLLENQTLLLSALCSALFIFIIVQRIIFSKKIKEERRDAVKRSRAVLNGQMIEQIAPLLPNFPCSMSDARFVGKPVDFVAFVGAGEDKPIEEILFIEVKTGGSSLSSREREVRAAVEKGKVRYVEYRI